MSNKSRQPTDLIDDITFIKPIDLEIGLDAKSWNLILIQSTMATRSDHVVSSALVNSQELGLHAECTTTYCFTVPPDNHQAIGVDRLMEVYRWPR